MRTSSGLSTRNGGVTLAAGMSMAVHARARSESDMPRRWRLAALCASSAAPPEEEPVAAPAPPGGNWNEALPVISATRILADEGWLRELPARPESSRSSCGASAMNSSQKLCRVELKAAFAQASLGSVAAVLPASVLGTVMPATWVRKSSTEATTLLESGTPRLVSLAVASFKASLPRLVSDSQ